jgi:hypothetical protein
MLKFLVRNRHAENENFVALHPDFLDLGRVDLSERRPEETRTAFTRDYGSGRPVSQPESWHW